MSEGEMIDILVGDCRSLLAGLPERHFQCCVTSPPYYGLRDYGHADQIGQEPSPEQYIAHLVQVFAGVRRVLRDDGTLWLNLGDSYCSVGGIQAGRDDNQAGVGAGQRVWRAGTARADGVIDKASRRNRNGTQVAGAKPKDLLMMPARVALALQADGWYLRSDIIWHKPNPMPESVNDRPTSAHEHVFLLSKRPDYYYDAAAIAQPSAGSHIRGPNATLIPGRSDTTPDSNVRNWDNGLNTSNARNVWTITPQPYAGAHFATMPRDLIEPCILAGTSKRGQCPHCGAPWRRCVDHTPMVIDRSDRTHALGRTRASGTMVSPASSVTTGWQPTCNCPGHTPIPQAVLDPFGGAATTGIVAKHLGHSSTLIELNPEYAQLAHKRIADADILGHARSPGKSLIRDWASEGLWGRGI